MKKCRYVLTMLLVLAVLSTVGCELENPAAVALDEVLSLSTEPEEARMVADGVSSITLVARVPADASEENRKVTFKTTTGSFATTDGAKELAIVARVDPSMTDRNAQEFAWARAELVAGQDVGKKSVTASASSYVAAKEVMLDPAYATALRVQTDSAFATTSGLVKPKITVTLLREGGKVSKGTMVRFVPTQGHVFDETISDADGKVTASYRADMSGVDASKPVSITISTDTDSGDELTATLVLELKP